MRIAILILFIQVISLRATSQYFSTGEDPARLRWRQIVTENFQLIYPESFEEQAQKLGHYFEKVYEYGGETMGHNPRKISVIFHTHTVRSNGLVGWAPRRVEIFTPPHQDNYAQDWLQQLALHEFRHVVQVDKIHSQLPEILKGLFGEQLSALVTGAYLPFWFIEGDAVISETAWSHFGRGRLPSFLMEHKAQVVEKGVFSYDKAYNGSFKDFVPDHYKLGYHLAGEIRARYGSGIWNYTLNLLSRNPFSINPVNRILRDYSGLNQEGLYLSVFDSLQKVWTQKDAKFIPEEFRIIKSPEELFVSYRYNHILPSGDIITLRTSHESIPRFVLINGRGNETPIITPGQIFDESVGYRNNLVVWSEYIPDTRWSHSGRSKIRLFDISTKRETSFFPEFKCFAPTISPDEHNVAVVETNFENQYYLSVYNAATGTLVKRYQTPDNNYLFSPAWRNQQEIIAIALTDEGKSLVSINPFNGTMEWLDEGTLKEIKQLIYHQDMVYFISGYSGTDDLYRMDLSTRNIERIARGRFGLGYPGVNTSGTELTLSDYTALGYRLVTLSHDKIKAENLNDVGKGVYELAEVLAAQEPGIVDFSMADTTTFVSKRYYKGFNLFNFHSRAPLVFDVNTYDVKPGISFLSQNKLGTATTSAGYKRNTSEKAGQYYAEFEYRGFYPVLAMEAATGKRADEYLQVINYVNQAGEVVRRDTTRKRFSWNETNLSLKAGLPLNLTSGAYFRLLQPEVRMDYTHYEHNSTTPENFNRGSLQTVAYRLYYHQLMRQAYRDILPDWGIVTDFTFRHGPWGDNDPGELMAAQMRGYVPGFMKNHGISLYSGLQQRKNGSKYGFSDAIRYPRGYHAMNNKQMVSLSADYRMPLLYPDWNMGRWIYFRRVKALLFGDYAWLSGDVLNNSREVVGSFRKNFYSMGVDLTADVNFLRIYAPANWGVRSVYVPELNKFTFEMLFSIDFTSF